MNKTIMIMPEQPDRTCGDCTACCDGWLTGNIYGHTMYPGKKCHYVCETGCSIYEDRPKDPCKTFECLWLKNKKVPMWMKPSSVGVILSEQQISGESYIMATEAGKRMDPAVLSWLFNMCIAGNNIAYQIDGGINWIGNTNFTGQMQKQKSNL